AVAAERRRRIPLPPARRAPRYMSMLHVVILAAGKGTRMKSSLPKVAHLLAGRPVIDHVVRAGSALAPTTTTVVVGHGADEVRRALGNWPDAQFVVQSPQLG